MTEYDLSAPLPAELAAMPALYLLGVGGPEDAAGIGRVETFVWRFVVLEGSDAAPAVLGFTSMPRLMALTRAVNGRQQGALPTEVLKIRPADMRGQPPVRLWLDLSADEYESRANGLVARERRLIDLEGTAAP